MGCAGGQGFGDVVSLEPLLLEVCLSGPMVIEQTTFSGLWIMPNTECNTDSSVLHVCLLWQLHRGESRLLRVFATRLWFPFGAWSVLCPLLSGLPCFSEASSCWTVGTVFANWWSKSFWIVEFLSWIVHSVKERFYISSLGNESFSGVFCGFTLYGSLPVTGNHLPFLWDTQSLFWTICSTFVSSPSLHILGITSP